MNYQSDQWGGERIIEALTGADNQTVVLSRQIPVTIFYTTAAVRENGEIVFYDDIYGHDTRLKKMLDKQSVK